MVNVAVTSRPQTKRLFKALRRKTAGTLDQAKAPRRGNRRAMPSPRHALTTGDPSAVTLWGEG